MIAIIIIFYLIPLLICLSATAERLYLKNKGLLFDIENQEDMFLRDLIISCMPYYNILYTIELIKVFYKEINK